MKAPLWAALLIAGAGSVAGCQRHAATRTECLAVLHRLVELELTESGFRDPAVRDRWKGEIARRFSNELGDCQGRRVPDDLAACLDRARTQEEIAHGCLR